MEAAKNATEVFSYNIGYYKYIKAVILLNFYKTYMKFKISIFIFPTMKKNSVFSEILWIYRNEDRTYCYVSL